MKIRYRYPIWRRAQRISSPESSHVEIRAEGESNDDINTGGLLIATRYMCKPERTHGKSGKAPRRRAAQIKSCSIRRQSVGYERGVRLVSRANDPKDCPHVSAATATTNAHLSSKFRASSQISMSIRSVELIPEFLPIVQFNYRFIQFYQFAKDFWRYVGEKHSTTNQIFKYFPF